jgi:Ni/Co efflux regulator RcnB
MASRQTQYDSLSASERKEQEEWAQWQIKLTGQCIEGYDWGRVDGGYVCAGGNHMITDELLAEGRGGHWQRL